MDPDILQYFEIEPQAIKSGVQCSSCGEIPMLWKTGWHCLSCGYTSKDSHVDALIDYAHLFDKKISNKQCCEFLGLPSRSIGSRVLRSLQLGHNNKYKGRTYDLSFILEK